MTRTARDQHTAAAQPDKASKNRVLHWLHQQQQHGQAGPAMSRPATAGPQPQAALLVTEADRRDRQPAQAAACGERAPDDDTGSLQTAADKKKMSARKKAAQLWKRWKAAMGMTGSKATDSQKPLSSNGTSNKLSQGLLQRHQQQQQYVTDSTSIAPVPPTILYGSLVAGSRGMQTVYSTGSAAAVHGNAPESQPISPTAAAVTAAAAGMPGNVVHAFNSSLYEQATSPCTPPRTTPRNSIAEPQDLPSASAVVAADWPKTCSAADGHASVAKWAAAMEGAAGAASVIPGAADGVQVPLVAQASSGSGTSSVLSPKTPSSLAVAEIVPQAHSAENHMLLQAPSLATTSLGLQQYGQQHSRASRATTAWQSDSVATSQLLAHVPAAAARDGSSLQPAAAAAPGPGSSKLLGTALTAYPAVAAELERSGLGLGHRVHAIMDVQPAAAGNTTVSWDMSSACHAVNSNMAQGPPPKAAKTLGDISGNTFAASKQNSFNVSSGNAFATSSSVHTSAAAAAAAGRGTDVPGWLLRAALLEDELQGRALEVQELLQQLSERRAAVQAALSSMQGGRATQRHRATLELSGISSSIKQLTGRAAALGSGLSVLQGCQTVLGSSRGTRLDQGSKVAVLQLVMSEVINKMPDEGLEQLEVCQGLPGLGRPDGDRLGHSRPGSSRLRRADSIKLGHAGREVCRLAGVGPERLARVNSGNGHGSSNSTNVLSRANASMCASGFVPPAPVHAGYGVVETCDTVCFDDEQEELQQQQLRQEQQHWHRYIDAESSDDECGVDDDVDDDVITTLSSVLSSRHYTPRKSLSYETRKAALAVARSGPWANPVASSAPAKPWTDARQQAAGNTAASMAAAAAGAAGQRQRFDGSFEVTLPNSQQPTAPCNQNKMTGGSLWEQPNDARQLPPVHPSRAAAGASLGSLLAAAPAAPSRRAVNMGAPLRSSRAGSVAYSDVESVYSLMCAEGGLPAWPEESAEYVPESFAAPAGTAEYGDQQQLQQWCGDDDGRSSTTSCVTACSEPDEEQVSGLGYSSHSRTAPRHEANVQQMAYGTAAPSSRTVRGTPAAVHVAEDMSALRGRHRAAPAARQAPAVCLPGVDQSASLHQVLAGAGGRETVDLNTMTVGDLLQALTMAVVRRQFSH